MLLIDGVRYEEWTPSSEDEIEQVVKEHAKDIFGEQSIYLDRKQKLKSLAGVGSIPDGLVIIFGDAPEWHIVEVELSSHDPYQHVVPQVDRFINAVDNPNSRNEIVEALYNAIENDDFTKVKIRQTIGQNKDIHKSLSDLIVRPPTITIVIEKDTSQLREALKKYTQKKVVEFRTFRREKAEAVHAHLFEPLYKPAVPTELQPPPLRIPVESMKLKVWRSYMEYEYIGIWKKHREFFPQYGATIELITDDGDIFRAKVGKSPAGSTELLGLRDWYSKNPDLKEGDLILITPVEPMKKYRIQTRRRQQ